MVEPGEEVVSQEEVRESQVEKVILEQLMVAKEEEVAEASEDVVVDEVVEVASGRVEVAEAMANSDGRPHTMRMEREEEITKKMDNNNVVVAAAEVVEEDEVVQDVAETAAAIKTEEVEDHPIPGRTEEKPIELLERNQKAIHFLQKKTIQARADFPTFSPKESI